MNEDTKNISSALDTARATDLKLEREAWNAVVAALENLDDDARERVLSSAAALFKISMAVTNYSRNPAGRSYGVEPPSVTAPFSEDRTISPKEFLIQKQPRTEVERVACLAYYLTHYRDLPAFKTFDISKLNTDAAQPKFSNASYAVENAAKTHYLASASKGNKQLSAAGEMFVQALPDREAARLAMATHRPRRKRKSAVQEESNGGNGQ